MPAKFEEFEVVSEIGSGSYGKCKKVRRKSDGKILVWKELFYGDMSEAEKKLLVSEVNLLRELKHEHIVKYYDRILDKSTTTLFIIMEFCEGGDLGSLISKCKRDRKYLEEDFIWKIMQQIISALQECHRRDRGQAIVHRDLKPANIFLDSNHNVKLGDFGLARVLHHDTSFAKTFVGTPYYMSPEQMNHMSYNEKSDIWSLGCLLYESCSLSPPFTAANQQALAVRIKEGRYRGIPAQYSDQLRDIISSMIRVNPLLRPSIEELLRHPKLQVSRKPRERPRQESSSIDPTEQDLVKREQTIKLKEKLLAEKEKELNNKEKELINKEKIILLKENFANEKLSRAEKLMQDYHAMNTNDRVLELRRNPDSYDEVHPSVLGDDKSKKKVHFVVNEKENDPGVFKEPTAPPLKSKHTNLQERLHRANLKSAALKQAEATAKLRSKKLLSMR